MSDGVDSRSGSNRCASVVDELPRHVLDNLLEGCQVISPDFRYLFVNAAVIRHGRKSREELLGKTMMEVYPDIEGTEMFEMLGRCLRDRSARQMENEFTFPDGTKGWFELRFEPVPEGVAVLSVDITERKQAEIALFRSQRALKALSECNQSLIQAEDERRFMQDVCELVVEHAGYRFAWIGVKQEDEGRSVEPIASAGVDEGYTASIRVSWGDGPTGQGPTGRAIRTGQIAYARCIMTDPAFGPWREEALARGYASSIALPFSVDGEVVGALNIYAAEPDSFDEEERALLVEMAMDLGHGLATLRSRLVQQRTLKALEESNTRYLELVSNLEDVVFSVASDGRIEYMSPAVERVYGYTPAEMVGRNFTDFVQPEDLPGLAVSFMRTLEGSTDPYEFRASDKQGRVRHLRAKSRARLAAGRPVAVDGVLVDFTELRRADDAKKGLEEQLRLSQRLESVGRLAGGIAHDFNNLLTIIISYSGFLLEELRESDPFREEIEQIRDAGQRAAALIRQLLAFSRKQVLEPVVLNLNEVIAGIENMLRRLIGEDVDIVIHMDDTLGNVEADPGQLEQVVMNLAVNARDAMPEGGMLTIETRNVELDEDYTEQHVAVTPGSYVLLSITDTGAGMDVQTRDQIFDPFFTTKAKGKGTGLGLSTVYGIVKQSGGNIWVYSEPGHGTTFKIYLPRVDAPTDEPRKRAEGGLVTGDETVLVVEDEAAVRRLAERILSKAGYKVLVAANGGEALLLCEQDGGSIDLLLTDVIMPKMSGKELVDRLAKICPKLRALYMSGYTDDAIVHRGVLDAGTKFISKPFSAVELTRKVREVLDEGPD